MQEILYVVLLIAAGQGIFLSVLLITDRNRKKNTYLGLIFLFFSFQLFDLVLLNSGKAIDYPYLVYWSLPFNFAFGPILYFYVSQFHKTSNNKLRFRWLHFLPFAIYTLYILFFFHFQSVSDKKAIIEQLLAIQINQQFTDLSIIDFIFPITIYIQLIIYLWVSGTKLNKDTFDAETRLWLKKVWYATLIIGCFGFIQFGFLWLGINLQPITGYIAAAIAVYYIYYGAIIFFKRPKAVFANKKPKYQYSNLEIAGEEKLLQSLENHMVQKRPFLNPDLSLKELAKETGLSERHISQVINTALGKNFSDFLNAYRVEEFKTQLFNPANSHLNILGIAMNCGFNSKSTFNTVFKRSTGLTPSQFKKQNLS